MKKNILMVLIAIFVILILAYTYHILSFREGALGVGKSPRYDEGQRNNDKNPKSDLPTDNEFLKDLLLNIMEKKYYGDGEGDGYGKDEDICPEDMPEECPTGWPFPIYCGVPPVRGCCIPCEGEGDDHSNDDPPGSGAPGPAPGPAPTDPPGPGDPGDGFIVDA